MFVCKRLEELRKKFHYSSQDCAYLLKISRNKYEQIEAGKLPPSCAEVLRMAKIFNVTTDYLMGMDLTEDDADYCINDKEDDDFVVRLTRLMAYNNEDVNAIALVTQKSPASIYAWKSRRSNPDIKSVIKLAKHFGCSSDHLLGVTTQRQLQAVS